MQKSKKTALLGILSLFGLFALKSKKAKASPEEIKCDRGFFLENGICIPITSNKEGWTDEDFSNMLSEAGKPYPGTFYQVVYGNTLTGIAKNALRNYYMSLDFPKEMGEENKKVRDYMIEIECSGWNDALYGSPKSELGGGHYAPHGRGISFMPVHSNNKSRMLDKKAPKRGVIKGGPGKEAQGEGKHGLLYLPLLNSDQAEIGEITSQNTQWKDGNPGSLPPKIFFSKGLNNVKPGNYGCKNGSLTID